MIRGLVYSILGFEPLPDIAEIKQKKKHEKKAKKEKEKNEESKEEGQGDKKDDTPKVKQVFQGRNMREGASLWSQMNFNFTLPLM